MKTMAAILLLSGFAFAQDKAAIAAAEAACGRQEMTLEVRVDALRHPTPTPESGKALIYVVQVDDIITRFGVDGKWVGADRGRTYFYFSTDPGEHHLCAISQTGPDEVGTKVALHELRAEAGISYFFVPHIVWGGQNIVLSEADPDEGRDLVAKAKFSSSHPR